MKQTAKTTVSKTHSYQNILLEEREENEFLTKEEELRLGRIIQTAIKAEQKIKDKTYTEDELPELERKIEEGAEATEELVSANIKLVHKQANIFKKKFPVGQDYEDIVQDGFTGLMLAARKYDPARNNKFATMAFSWINQSIIRESNKKSRLVRLPENRINDYTHINRLLAKVDQSKMGQNEIEDYILKNTDLKKKDLLNIRGAAMQHASLNKVVGEEENGKELMDFVSDDLHSESSETNFMNDEMRSTIVEMINELSEMKRDIVIAAFKFNPDVTSEMIREKYDLPKSKFRKYQIEAVKEMRSVLKTNGYTFADFLES